MGEFGKNFIEIANKTEYPAEFFHYDYDATLDPQSIGCGYKSDAIPPIGEVIAGVERIIEELDKIQPIQFVSEA